MTWDLTPESYDRDLPTHLSTIARQRAKKRALAQDQAQQRAAERALLDTGPPDSWANEPPDEVLAQWVEEWMAEAEAEDRERSDAVRNAELDDALATMLDEELSAQS